MKQAMKIDRGHPVTSAGKVTAAIALATAVAAVTFGTPSSAQGAPIVTGPHVIDGTTVYEDSVVVGSTGNSNVSLTVQNAGKLNSYGGNSVRGYINGAYYYSGSGYLGLNAGTTGTATVTGAGSQWSNTWELFVGYFGSGTLNVEAGGKVFNSIGSGFLGYYSGSTGTATVTGAGSEWANTGDLNVGGYGSGTLNVEAGGKVFNGNGYLGDDSGSTGTATVTGAGSEWTNSGSLYVGGYESAAGGTGQLNVLNNGLVSVSETTKLWNAATVTINGGTLHTKNLDRTLGTLNHNDGTVHVDGGTYTQSAGPLVVSGNTASANPLFQLSNNATTSGVQGVIVGSLADRDGQLLISSGSVLTNSGSGSIGTFGSVSVSRGEGYLGLNAGSIGTVTVTGEGSAWTNNGRLYVGMFGAGELAIEDGGSVSSSMGYLGRYAGATGTATVSGTDSTWTNDQTLYVATQGSADLTIEAGGAVIAAASYIGSGSGSTGTATVAGEGSALTSSGDQYVGYEGTGTLNVRSGATVSSAFGALGVLSGSTGNATVTGAGSEWANTGDLYIGDEGSGTLRIEEGGAVSSYHGYIGDDPNATGSAIVTGEDSVWTNAGQLYVGVHGAGTLTIANGGVVSAAGGVLVRSGGTINGNGGTLVGNVINEGLIAPGSSPGVLDITGDLATSGTVELEIASLTSFDILNVSGDLTAGGTFEVVLLDGFSPTLGDSFGLLNFGTFIADGYTLDFSNALLASGLSWDASSFESAGVLSVVPEPGTLSLVALAGLQLLRRRRTHRAA